MADFVGRIVLHCDSSEVVSLVLHDIRPVFLHQLGVNLVNELLEVLLELVVVNLIEDYRLGF